MTEDTNVIWYCGNCGTSVRRETISPELRNTMRDLIGRAHYLDCVMVGHVDPEYTISPVMVLDENGWLQEVPCEVGIYTATCDKCYDLLAEDQGKVW